MDGMLSQDEINALLSGMDLSENIQQNTDQSSLQSKQSQQEEQRDIGETLLTEVEQDVVGEVANISMGSSATTLYSLVNRKVNITTPVVTMANWEDVLGDYERPYVFIQIKYTRGLQGTNILVLKDKDVKVITDLMMGGDGTNTDEELGDLHLSAISEAMNQMMGSAATSLSTMLGTLIDISPPDASLIDVSEYHNGGDISPFLGGTFVKIAFRMQIHELVESSIMQLYPVDFAKDLVEIFINKQRADHNLSPKAADLAKPSRTETGRRQPQSTDNSTVKTDVHPAAAAQPMYGTPDGMNMKGQMGMQQQMGMQGQMGMPVPNTAAQMYMPPQVNMQQPNINVQPAQFQSFSNDFMEVAGKENIGLIMDVPLEVTVELGRTTKSIAEILDFAPGIIIELDRIAGEPIDVLVNGKFVAKGEVVVIEESFGIRVTEIIKE